MVTLRPLTADDWPAVHEWAQLPEACRYQAWGPNSPQQTRDFVRSAAEAWQQQPQMRFPYAVVAADGTVVGNAELKLRGGHEGEISYAVHPAMWGQGVATEAAGQLLELSFHEHGLDRVFATCDPRNVASARVLTKLGLRYETRLHHTMLIRDGWRDSDRYAIGRPEGAGRATG